MLSEVEMLLYLTSSGGHDQRRPPKIKQTHSTSISNKYVVHGAFFFFKCGGGALELFASSWKLYQKSVCFCLELSSVQVVQSLQLMSKCTVYTCI